MTGELDTFVVLLRGINVGGKNAVPMAGLRRVLEEAGFADVATYIASGNAILRSDRTAADVAALVEDVVAGAFPLDDGRVRALALPRARLRSVIEDRPPGFGERPGEFHSDAIFLIGIDAAEAMQVFAPREGVDTVWPGDGVVYSQRVSALRTKSRLSTVMASPLYKSMTIRSWQTTLKLAELADLAELVDPDSTHPPD